MERVQDFVRRWRSRYEGDRVFRVLVVTVVLAAFAVTSSGLMQTPTYEASTQVLVGGQQEGQWQTLEYREQPLPPEKMHAIDSRPVAEEVLQRLEGLPPTTPADLLDNLTVEHDGGTPFIQVSYTDTDPGRAQAVVNTLGKVASEQGVKVGGTNFTTTTWEKAALPERPVSPNPLRNGLLTLVGGLVLSAVLALPRSRPLAARGATLGNLVRRSVCQGVLLPDYSIIERVKEKKLLLALGREPSGKLTAVGASLATSLSVEEANRILFELAAKGHLQVTVEDGKLLYSFWERG